MKRYFYSFSKLISVVILIPVLILVSIELRAQNTTSNKELAKQYISCVYIEDSGQLEKLISEDIVSTYPVYKEIFNKVGLSGKEEVIQFANHFKQRWHDREIKFREVIADKNKVVLIWSFTARMVDENSANPDNGQKQNWGGITIIYFNDAGKINAEVGLENDPGPFELLEQTRNQD